MKLSVLILTWNAAQRIERCLKALEQSKDLEDMEIIVIDNGSEDATVDIINKNFPKVSLTSNKENVGFAKANNQAYKKTIGEYVLLLNDDVVVQPHTLSKLVAYLDNQTKAAGVTCKFLNQDGSTQYGYHRQLPTMGRMVASAAHHYIKITTKTAQSFLMIDDPFTEEKVIEQAALTCIMLRRSVIESTDYLLDEKFPIFFNDVELSHRLKNAGHKVWLVPATSITHQKAQSTSRLDPYQAKEEYYLSLFRYFRAYKRYGDYWFGRFFFAWLLLMIFLFSLAGLNQKYFDAPITNRSQSLHAQRQVLRAIWYDKPVLTKKKPVISTA